MTITKHGPNEYWLTITGELFGPFRTEREATLSIGPALLTME